MKTTKNVVHSGRSSVVRRRRHRAYLEPERRLVRLGLLAEVELLLDPSAQPLVC
jgi:hypothetical protein